MDSKKIMAVITVTVVAVAAIGIYFVTKNDDSLKIVYLNKGSYESIMVAEEKGFFNGLDYDVDHLLVTGSGQDAVNALLVDEADIAATGEGPAMTALNKYGKELVLLCSYTIGIGGQIWIAHPGMGITLTEEQYNEKDRAENMANKMMGGTIGIIGESSTEAMFKRWCDAFGLPLTNDNTGIDIKPFPSGEALMDAFSSGDIDFLAGSEPFPSIAMSKGGIKIGSSADINANSVTVLMTIKDKYEANEQKMKDFIKAMYDATIYINENKSECIELCAARIGWTIEEQTASFDATTFDVSYSELIIDSLFSCADSRRYTELTKEVIRDACPLKSYLDSLASV